MFIDLTITLNTAIAQPSRRESMTLHIEKEVVEASVAKRLHDAFDQLVADLRASPPS